MSEDGEQLTPELFKKMIDMMCRAEDLRRHCNHGDIIEMPLEIIMCRCGFMWESLDDYLKSYDTVKDRDIEWLNESMEE